MEIILKLDMKSLGQANDIVEVKSGYARNYLIPRGYAIVANVSNKKMAIENARQATHKKNRIREMAEKLAERIGTLTLKIGAKAGETGKIFGSVSPIQIAEKLGVEGFDVDRKKIILKENPRQLGTYSVTLDLHHEIQHEITIEVVAE